ncbi:MAG: tetratricopeptide repeat protein [Thermoanaerobaculia bacterium]
MPLQLDQIFQGRQAPRWLHQFQTDPDTALLDLLLGRAILGHLNVDEPSEILLDWLETLGPDFEESVDAALARWIERSWGRFSLPESKSAAVLAIAWSRAGSLIAFESCLVQSARCLRRLFPQDRLFLSALSEGRARDPEGRAWLALARHQKDRFLLQDWWRMSNLAPDVPWYHGAYGIQGLRGLPAESAAREGTFPAEVAEGLARLASGLFQRVTEGWLEEATARAEFLRTARLTMDAYPLRDRWLSFWRHALQARRISEEEGPSWIKELFPQELKTVEQPPKRTTQKRWAEPDPAWPIVIKEVAARLRSRDLSVLGDAEELLRDQAKFAELTGNTYFVVRSACNFAARVRESRPDLALAWAELARRFDPWTAFAWTIMTASLLSLDRIDEARDVATRAIERFPDNVVARNGLAEILKAQGHLVESELVYQETVSRFPGDLFARNGLAEVLKAQRCLPESELVYQETVSRFSADVVARNGLAEVLKAQGHLVESELVYQETVSRFPGDLFARNGLAEVLMAQGGLRKAEMLYRETVEKFPADEVAVVGLAKVLKVQRRFPEAEALYREAVSRFPKNTSARDGLKEVLRKEGRLVEENTMAVSEELPLDSKLPDDTLKVTPFRTEDLEFLLQDALLLRRWASQKDRSYLTSSPGTLRELARERLRGLVSSETGSPVMVGELGLLTLEDEHLEEALALLREAAKRYPGSARVRYALARAERKAAARRRHLDLDHPEAPLASWRRLSRFDERFVPLQLLGEARTWLAQVDGSLLAEKARGCLGELGYRIQTLKHVKESDPSGFDRDKPGFEWWWASEIQNHLFGAQSVKGYEEVPDLALIRENIASNKQTLDRLEEDWLGHWASS